MLIKNAFHAGINRWLGKRRLLIAISLGIFYTALIVATSAQLTRQGVVGNVIIPAIKTNIQIPLNFLDGLSTPVEKLAINIKHSNFLKIAHKRSEAKKTGELVSSPDDWVSAKISYGTENYSAKIRLKGQLEDHWRDDGYWSYKINMRGGETLLGMDRFAVQHPRTRDFLNEWYFHKILRSVGVIALRYDFLPVVVNGVDYPVFALEENFEKRLLENNDRREGPIFRLYERTGPGHLPIQSISISQESKLLKSEAGRQLARRAQRLTSGFTSGELGTSQVFDLKSMSYFFAINDLFGNYHSMGLKDIRFYLNPITGMVEPMPIDNQDIGDLSKSGMFSERFVHSDRRHTGEHHLVDWRKQLFSDPSFSRAYGAALQKISDKAWLDSVFSLLEEDAGHALSVLYKSYPYYQFEHKHLLYKNQSYIRSRIAPKKGIRAIITQKPEREPFSQNSSELKVQLANTHSLPVEVIGVSTSDGNPPILLKKAVILANRATTCTEQNCQSKIRSGISYSGEILELVNSESSNQLKRPLQLVSRVVGSESTFLTHLFSPAEIDDALPLVSELQKHRFIEVDEKRKIIKVKTGKWRVQNDILVPPGFKFSAGAKTFLDLVSGSSILSYSPFEFIGNLDNPITISSSDSTSQGVAVLRSAGRSYFENVVFMNLGEKARNGNRFSGSVSFYESDVSMKNVSFLSNRSEDALNIVRSEFDLDHIIFRDIFADALDADFCKGKIANSTFLSIGNDGIDVSGSEVAAQNISMQMIGDKGISVGERSKLTAEKVSISGAKVAIASKDDSLFLGSSIVIEKSASGLVSYQKKPEYGPSSIEVSDILFSNTREKTLVETGSSIKIDDHLANGHVPQVYDKLYGAK
jgi:hypothetical protein